MTARVAALFTLCMLTTGAAMVPDVEVTPASALGAASRLARDGDMQADWNKLLERPSLTAFDDGLARMRPALERVRRSFAVMEWLEATWTAIRWVFEYGNAWSHALLFSRGEAHAGL